MKIIIRSAFIGACLIFLSACQNASAPPNGARTVPENLRLAFVTNNSSDFWTIARKGTQKADAELADVTVDFRIPSEGTAADQKRVIDDLMASGVQGIALSPVDPENQTQAINDAAKRVLLVTQDSDAPQSDRAFYVGTDNVAAGRRLRGR